ncbi:MAG: UvrD-helicase domain-containing protein, partial [Nitrososphaerales archaeon]
MAGAPDETDQFINSSAHRMRCLAGPGTGKTWALQRRVERLIADRHVQGSRIFAVTFTRQAAAQLKEALQSLGDPTGDEVHTSTLHSYAFGLLKREEAITALGRSPRPCLTFEMKPLHHDLAVACGGVRASQDLLKALEAMWARMQSEVPGSPRSPTDVAFESSFLAWMRFHQAMGIGELVPLAVQFLNQNPVGVGRAEFDHVIVDEYQDLNRADQNLVELIGSTADVAVIGDDDQSIFSFRHAYPEGIRTWAGVQTLPVDIVGMTVSRRSDGRILDVSNHLIRQNPCRARGDILPEPGREASGEITVIQWASREKETRGIAETIRRIQSTGRLPSHEKLIVIVPRREFGVDLQQQLTSLGVTPVKLHCSPDWDSPELVRGATLIRLLDSPEDRVAIRVWLGLGDTHWRRDAYARLRELCERTGRSPADILGDAKETKSSRLSLFHQKWLDLQTELNVLRGLPMQQQVDRLFPPGGPMADLGERINRALGMAANASTTDRLVRALESEEDDDLDEGINIMTAFGSKGLTCHTVI